MENSIRIDRTKLHPWLNYLLTKGLKKCNKKGLYIIVTEGFRTAKYQDELYAQGRTKSGIIVTNARGSDYASQHQWGIAFDIAIVDDTTTPKKENVYDIKAIKKAAKIFKSIGLGWGGDWTNPVDTPHLYLKKWGSTTTKLKQKFKTLTNFKKYWKRTVKGKSRLYRAKNMDKKHIKCWIPKGAKVDVLWYSKLGIAKVKYDGKYGYVFRSRFKKIK